MEKKKRLKFFNTFQELEEDQLRQNLAMSLEERWEAFWKMQRNHQQLFADESINVTLKKRIIFSKPEWI